jgi:hypothetical protein
MGRLGPLHRTLQAGWAFSKKNYNLNYGNKLNVPHAYPSLNNFARLAVPHLRSPPPLIAGDRRLQSLKR